MKIKWFLLWIFLLSSLEGNEEKKTICLNMIVKNETKVIRRCLASLKPIIDYWVIVDTGSTDGTQRMIREFMRDIPGELYERTWVDFAHNRNEALSLAKNKGDYVVFIDADEEFLYKKDFMLPALDKDAYFIEFDHSGSRYGRILMINNLLPWKWVGVLHEYLECNGAQNIGKLAGVKNLYRSEGCRSQDPKKFEHDAEILEKALQNDPENTRYVFYLAQSYRDARNYQKALKWYEKRAKMGGWEEEVFWSLYQIGLLHELLKSSSGIVVKSYCDAYQYRPTRAEPLCRLATFLRNQENHLLAYLVAKHALSIPKPNDLFIVEQWVYDYWLKMERAVNAYWIGRYSEAFIEADLLLQDSTFPKDLHHTVEDVKKWSLPKMDLTKGGGY